MLNFFLGLIVGLLLAMICFLSIRRNQTFIERTIKQVENKFKEKGEVYVPNDDVENLKAWMNDLPKEGEFSNHPGFNK